MKKLLKSFGYALNGLLSVIRSERNFSIHLMAGFLAVVLGFYLGISKVEWLIIVISIAAVMATETMNTAVEKLCDIVSPHYHDKIKIVKDLAAAAVLIVSIAAIVIGVIIFLPLIIQQIPSGIASFQ